MNTDREPTTGEHKQGSSWPEVCSESMMSNSFLGNLVEVCVVTRDHRRTMEGLVRLGIGPWRVYTFTPDNVTRQTYNGEPASFSLKVCFAEGKNVIWELMEPLGGPNIVEDFLEEHGEGIHHLAFDCEDIPLEQRIAAFAERGFPLTQSGGWLDQNAFENAFAFFGTEEATSAVFETYVFPEEFEYPEPEEWFPAPPPKEETKE